VFQQYIRVYWAVKEYLELKRLWEEKVRKITKLQSLFRRYYAHKELEEKRRQSEAAKIFQKHIRRINGINHLEKLRELHDQRRIDAATIMANYVRRWSARKFYAQLEEQEKKTFRGDSKEGRRGAETARGRGAEAERGRGADTERGRGAETERGRGAEAERGRGADTERGRGAEAERGRGAEAERGRGAETERRGRRAETRRGEKEKRGGRAKKKGRGRSEKERRGRSEKAGRAGTEMERGRRAAERR